jgi:hypothetical protein
MSKTNSEVAAAFVHNGKPCKGSNTEYTEYTVSLQGAGSRTFTSYSTVVAYIRDNILWWVDYGSNSTQRQLSYIHREWRNLDPEGKRMMCVDRVLGGASLGNVAAYIKTAQQHLQDLATPRIRNTTKAAHWGKFLSRMAETEKLLTMPCYDLPPGELANARLTVLRAIRDSNDANPTGLDTVITNARAIYALEGETL